MSAIWTEVGSNATAVLTLIGNLLKGVVGLFVGTEGLTPLGQIIIIPVAIGVVIWAIYFVFGLINKIKIGRRG